MPAASWLPGAGSRPGPGFQPQATELESKILLSLTATPAPEPAEVTIQPERSGTTPAEAVTNTVKGRYFAAEDNRAADAPLHVQLNGNGRVNGIGNRSWELTPLPPVQHR